MPLNGELVQLRRLRPLQPVHGASAISNCQRMFCQSVSRRRLPPHCMMYSCMSASSFLKSVIPAACSWAARFCSTHRECSPLQRIAASRAPIDSSATRASMISAMSFSPMVRTRVRPVGSNWTNPARSSSIMASRTGPRLTPKRNASPGSASASPA